MKLHAGGAAATAGIKFQQQLGAFLGASLLSGNFFDSRLNLGDASPVWVRFETEAPIDDILVATSHDGYIAIQAKTSVSLSKNIKSPFGKTVAQFIRHWLVCRDGDGSQGWNRPLNPNRDRLVLAISANAPKTVRSILPSAFQNRSQLGNAPITKEQKRVLGIFDECVTEIWKSITSEKLDLNLFDQLAQMVIVLVFDPTGVDKASTITRLETLLPNPNDAPTALNALEVVSGQMMEQRGGFDLKDLRALLTANGVKLETTPRYRQDITLLCQHTQSVAVALKRHEEIEGITENAISIERECQEALRRAAQEHSLLVVGEPGVGKSGVLNALTRELLGQGKDVLELAVDQHSVESIEGLQNNLGLTHDLLEVLEAWDGAEPGWLIIDALDATRGGRSEGVFRTLVEQVLSRCERWRVVASIRTFDLRMGQRFRTLFKGKPTSIEFADPAFSDVRHIRVPPWSESELQKLLDQSPALSAVLADTPMRLLELISIPFNLQLLSELIAANTDMTGLENVSSQVELLRFYRSHRIDCHGTPGQICLRSIAEAMVKVHMLQIRKQMVEASVSSMIDTLSHEGVLISVENDLYIRFRHHILFDYIAAWTLLDPKSLIHGVLQFPKEKRNGLMLAPALAFTLQEIWGMSPDRADFWTAVGNILTNKSNDPVVRSATSRISVEYPIEVSDVVWIAKSITESNENAVGMLPDISGALSIRIEDHTETPLKPWIKLLAELAPCVQDKTVAVAVRFLLSKFIERTEDTSLRNDLGIAARALLEYGYSLEAAPDTIVPAAIRFVADTYATNPTESRRLLMKVFDDQNFTQFAWKAVPAVCGKIENIVTSDPKFGVEIYKKTYALDVIDERVTQIGESQILSLTSTARQDYETSRYFLGEFASTFLNLYPTHAIEAIIIAVESCVARKHPISPDLSDHELSINGRTVRLREDWSHIWAHDPNGTPYDDLGILVSKVFEHLKSSEEEVATQSANYLIDKASLAVFWSRLFIAAVERNDAMIDLLFPFASTEQFLIMSDTRKDAIDVVVKGYDKINLKDREKFEQQVLTFDFSRFANPQKAREGFVRTLFSIIGRENVVTNKVKELLVESIDQESIQNKRPFVVKSSWGETDRYDWIADLDKNHPANAELMSAIDSANNVLESKSDTNGAIPENVFDVLNCLKDSLYKEGVNLKLKGYGEGVIGSGCQKILEKNFDLYKTDITGTKNFLDLLKIAANSINPEVDDETERSFEEHASWGSPAARVEAAQATLNLVLKRPDLFPQLADQIDMLLADPHPAVRLQAVLYLIRIWDLDREGFWKRLKCRLNEEENFGVLKHLINGTFGRLLHAEPELIEELIFDLLERFPHNGQRQALLQGGLTNLIAILWIKFGCKRSRSAIGSWLTDLTKFDHELICILGTIGGAYDAGLKGENQEGENVLRKRALNLTSEIVDAVCAGLDELDFPDSENEVKFRKYSMLLNAACRELYLATDALNNKENSGHQKCKHELNILFDEVYPILRQIGKFSIPSTAHRLFELLEVLLPLNPDQTFDLVAHTLRHGAQQTGYQFESLGADLIVRLVGVFLADHKEIFENEERRENLIYCLEIFMNAGWPAAQRLLYRLPELVQ